VDPDSNKIFSNCLDFTAPMVSTTIMVTGVKFLFKRVLETLFSLLLLLLLLDLGSKVSAM